MLVREWPCAHMNGTWVFPTIAELQVYEQRQREERADEHMAEFFAQMNIATGLPLVEPAGLAISGGEDPTGVIVALD